MALLVCSRFVMHEQALAYVALLAATASLGVGFGFTVPALNTFAAAFFPHKVEKAVLGLNACWVWERRWPRSSCCCSSAWESGGACRYRGGGRFSDCCFSARGCPSSDTATDAPENDKEAEIAGAVLDFCRLCAALRRLRNHERQLGSVYMTKHLGASAALASLALTIFWERSPPGACCLPRSTNGFPQALPFGSCRSSLPPPSWPRRACRTPIRCSALSTFAAAGLGCSALLPLVISFGQKELTTVAASVAGGLICAYQVGYGIAAFGVGPLQVRAGLRLETIYGGTAVVALAMACCHLLSSRPRPGGTLSESAMQLNPQSGETQ